MSLLGRALRSSIGKKQIVALTGLALVLFLVGHLAGNLLLLLGQEAFDAYAAALEGNPLLIPIEIILLTIFLLHVGLALKSSLENRSARDEAYVIRGNRGKKNFANSTMVFSGVVILVFLILHLLHFKFADRPAGLLPDGTILEDSLFVTVVLFYKQSLAQTAWYVLAVCIVGFHVSHGFQSAFQSLGIHHGRYTPCLKWTSVGLGIVLALGYAILPLYCRFAVELQPVVQEAAK